MDKTKLLQQGDEAKFQIAIKNFDMDENNFTLKLVNGYRRTAIEIPKSKMFRGTDGKWYFLFETDKMVGKVEAVCTWYEPDTDCPDGLRTETDRQTLCFVATTPRPQLVICPTDDKDGKVTYTRTEQSDVADEYAYLSCDDYDRIVTADNMVLLVLKAIDTNNQNE